MVLKNIPSEVLNKLANVVICLIIAERPQDSFGI